MRMRKRKNWLSVLMSLLTSLSMSCPGNACTAPTPPTPEEPEIEIEPEFEDYDSSRDRVIYDVSVEIEVGSPTSTAQCQCGLGLGSSAIPLPESFDVTRAFVGLRHGASGNLDLDSFAGFERDPDVDNLATQLPGFLSGGTPFGFSQGVDPFIPPVLQAGDVLLMGFRIEFAPADFDAVNNIPIQFLAGSDQPGHLLGVFQNYAPTLSLPPIVQPAACDLNGDDNCDVDDLNDMLREGPLNHDVPTTPANVAFDMSGDGYLNMHDADLFLAAAAAYNGLASPYMPGDANLDGNVDGTDFGRWNSNKFDRSLYWDEGDFNADGFVDGSDFGIWNAHKFTSSQVPEPAISGLGLLVILGAWRSMSSRRR